jgi:hypothetical protein
MHIIWKRPDGYHDALPEDFHAVELGGRSRIWLHKKDHNQYPFQITGGWEESSSTVRLNNMINLIPQAKSAWLEYLSDQYDNMMADDRKQYIASIKSWLEDLSSHIKGDRWEVDILKEALTVVKQRIEDVSNEFFAL